MTQLTDKNKSSSNSESDIPKVTSDVYFKTCMSNLSLARDFLSTNLPEPIKQRIRIETLNLAPQEYITAALRQKTVDIVYTVQLNNEQDELGFLMVLIEHQTKPQRKMPLRMLESMLTIMRQASDNHPDKDQSPLPVVIPIILSNYPHPYPYSVRFLDLFDHNNQPLMAELLNNDLPLMDLASTPDDTLVSYLRASVMLIALKHCKKIALEALLPLLKKSIHQLLKIKGVDPDEASQIVKNLLYFVYNNAADVSSNPDDTNRVLVAFEQELPIHTGEVIMTLSERYEEQIKMSAQQAMIEGRLEGKLEGIEDNTRRVAINMLKMGMNEQQICQCTDIPIDKLDAIKLELEEETEPHALH